MDITRQTKFYKRLRTRKKYWMRVLTVLASVVVFCTTYALILPAITLETSEDGEPGYTLGVQYSCGLGAHVHTDDCYNSDGSMLCTIPEHQHGDDCSAVPAADMLEVQSDGMQADDGVMPLADDGPKLLTDTITPPGIVINLFDYWIEKQENDNETYEKIDKGINQFGALKFVVGGNDGQDINMWTGENNGNKGVRQGIVENVLNNGYPRLTKNNKSLDYLFDPAVQNNYKASYPNLKNLLVRNNDGYYDFNATNYYAQLNEKKDGFDVYDNKWLTQQYNLNDSKYNWARWFFPFDSIQSMPNKIKEGYKQQASPINHFFGVTITSNFTQQNGGKVIGKTNEPVTFEFTGDDDVWIFIDDVLVADLGGIHDAASVKIDFSTGSVEIDNVFTSYYSTQKKSQKTTIYEQFQNAGRAGDQKNWSGGTFADGTIHTLKLFYLERGGWESNLMLKFNLTTIPATAVYKTDQNGDPLAGAGFAVYTTDKNYNITKTTPVFTGTTDTDGRLVFADTSGAYYTMDEIEETFGTYFILRETKVPDGYRCVQQDTKLYVENGMLHVTDSYESGVWVGPVGSVIAPTELTNADASAQKYNYYGNGADADGLLFAVVLKKPESAVDFTNVTNTWLPVYGNDENGYSVLGSGNENILKAAKEQAALNAQNGGTANIFTRDSNGAMTLEMTNLPGQVERYYAYQYQLKNGEIDKINIDDVDYVVAYFYSKNGTTLDGINANDMVRIVSHMGGGDNKKFEIRWGATIQVPDIGQRLYFQKLNPDGKLVNDAGFALYNVAEDNGIVYYLTDKNEKIQLISNADTYLTYGGEAILGESKGTFKIDNTTGVITVTIGAGTYNITPAINAKNEKCVGKTGALQDADEVVGDQIGMRFDAGTGYFQTIKDGYYILREISAPPGYFLNPTETKVIVNSDGVFANAGTENDGVDVGKGLGYIVASMNTFASQGKVENSLSWMYIFLQVLGKDSGEQTKIYDTFASFKYDSSDWIYAKQNEGDAIGYASGTTADAAQAMVTYLEYISSGDNPNKPTAHFDYFPTSCEKDCTHGGSNVTAQGARMDKDEKLQTLAGQGTRGLYTKTGWSKLEVHQDWLYGEAHKMADHYENLHLQGRTKDVTRLFSKSTFVRYTDTPCSIELPATGGNGVFHYQIAGAVLLLGSAGCLCYIYQKRKRKEKRASETNRYHRRGAA